jgi:hypothetical protein
MQGVLQEVLALLVTMIFWLVISDVSSLGYKWVPMPSATADLWALRTIPLAL